MKYWENITIIVQVFNHPPNFINSDNFRREYLEGSCKACGSRSHSLFERTRSRTRSEIGTISYVCPMVKYLNPMEPVFPNDQIRIYFHIDAHKYAEDCNFIKEEAEYRFPELEACRSPVYPITILTRFKNKVRNICKEVTDRLIEENKAAIRESFLRVFLTKPCRLCGSHDHHMLREEEQEDGSRTKHYNCPIAAYTDVDLQRGLPGTRIYRISSEKLAEVSGYNRECVNENITRILDTGHGRYMSNSGIFRLRDLAYQCCDQERENWEFKREQLTEQDQESEDEG